MTHLIAMRGFAILAAMMLVGSFALATIMPPDMALREGLALFDSTLPDRLRDGFAAHLPSWVWSGLILPILVRPLWLVPAGLGVVCAGAAVTFGSAGNTQRSRRRRS